MQSFFFSNKILNFGRFLFHFAYQDIAMILYSSFFYEFFFVYIIILIWTCNVDVKKKQQIIIVPFYDYWVINKLMFYVFVTVTMK